ncbi:uncharacterized protein [Euphorbia lathyris]|uniref:uncharacterized protein n=1 Tax=Euphorbia lathyris TaxID=212925 RepID=UPI0033134A09
MGVAVLNPRDCLQNPISSHQGLLSPPPRVRSSRNPNPNPNRSNRAQQPTRRKRSPNSKSASPPRAVVHLPAKDLVMGQVKILKRGEKIPETTSPKKEDLDLGSTHRLGPDPELVPTQIRLAESKTANGFYAGSAFVSSPPPSSLPLPVFFMKKTAGIADATSDLRRILGLVL